jgi:hypothetical protein
LISLLQTSFNQITAHGINNLIHYLQSRFSGILKKKKRRERERDFDEFVHIYEKVGMET